MAQNVFHISVEYPFSLKLTALSHGWVNLPPYKWDSESEVLSRCDKTGQTLVAWSVRQVAPEALAITTNTKLDDDMQSSLKTLVSYCLMLDWSPEDAMTVAKGLNPQAAEFMERGGGRFLRGASFYEDFYKTLCTINTSWTNTIQMITALHDHFGKGASLSPGMVCRSEPKKLQKLGRLGYRAQILYDSTNLLVSNHVISPEKGDLTVPLEKADLLSIHGIGHYAANHLRILQCDYSHIPVDSEVRAYCLAKHNLTGDINDYYSSWGDFRFLGYKLERILEKQNWIGG